MLDVAPEAFDKDVIKGTAPAVHADDHAFAFEYSGVRKTRKLRALVAVEHFRCAMVA